MNHSVSRILLAVAAAGCLTRQAGAVVVVAEDFFYNETTKSITDLSGFGGSSFGGGQNGSGGVWDDRWGAVGGVTIVGAGAAPPLDTNPHTAAVSQFASAASLQRAYAVTGAAGAQTLYFAGDFRMEDALTPNIFAEFGILSPAAALDNPSLSLGITDSAGGTSATFFANLGTTMVTADPIADPDNALVGATSVRIVGKLEVNVLPDIADYDDDTDADGADFLLWQRTLGAAVAPGAGADGDSSGTIDAPDLALWRSGFGQKRDRLTVYFNPTGVETTNATVLTVTGNVINSFGSGDLQHIATLNADAAGGDSDRPHFIDNLAIGTTWADVATVNVPRLTLRVNTTTGQTSLINNSTQAIDLAYYEILSEGDSLNPAGWNSLDDQNTSGGTWVENSPNAGQLIESNLTSATTIAAGGGTLALGAAFAIGDPQDLVARWGTKQGADGLLNVANVVYVAAVAAVPEPTSWCLLMLGAAAAAGRRTRSSAAA